jgi:hypothetical protein
MAAGDSKGTCSGAVTTGTGDTGSRAGGGGVNNVTGWELAEAGFGGKGDDGNRDDSRVAVRAVKGNEACSVKTCWRGRRSSFPSPPALPWSS